MYHFQSSEKKGEGEEELVKTISEKNFKLRMIFNVKGIIVLSSS